MSFDFYRGKVVRILVGTEEGLAWLDERLAHAGARAADRYQIWVVGGSVAYMFAESKGAARLTELLGADPRFAGRTLELQNYAHPEYKEPQQLMRLTEHLP